MSRLLGYYAAADPAANYPNASEAFRPESNTGLSLDVSVDVQLIEAGTSVTFTLQAASADDHPDTWPPSGWEPLVSSAAITATGTVDLHADLSPAQRGRLYRLAWTTTGIVGATGSPVVFIASTTS